MDLEAAFPCQWASCSRLFTTQEALYQHAGSHCVPEKFACVEETCSAKFSSKQACREHLKTHFNMQKIPAAGPVKIEVDRVDEGAGDVGAAAAVAQPEVQQQQHYQFNVMPNLKLEHVPWDTEEDRVREEVDVAVEEQSPARARGALHLENVLPFNGKREAHFAAGDQRQEDPENANSNNESALAPPTSQAPPTLESSSSRRERHHRGPKKSEIAEALIKRLRVSGRKRFQKKKNHPQFCLPCLDFVHCHKEHTAKEREIHQDFIRNYSDARLVTMVNVEEAKRSLSQLKNLYVEIEQAARS